MTTAREKIFYAIFILLALAYLVGSCVGCAAGPLVLPCHDRGPAAYTHEQPMRPFQVTIGSFSGGMYVDAWTADGGPTRLTTHNPTSQLRQVHVVCEPSVSPTYIDFGHIEWWTCLDPHTEKVRLVEFMNIDAMNQVCDIPDQWIVHARSQCIEQDRQ